MKSLGHVFLAVMAVFAFLFYGSHAQTQAAPEAAALWVTPLEMDFGPVGVGLNGTRLVATITNSGDVPLTGWAGGVVPAPFNATQDCNIVGGVLPGHSCHYFFTFSPTAAGAFTATSISNTNAGQITIVVHGTGVAPSLSYDAHALDMGTVRVSRIGAVAAPTQVVTIRNTGPVPLSGWAGGAVPAPFNASQDCNIVGGVLPGQSCHYFFSFSTASTGFYTATSSSATNAGPINVDLQGDATLLILGANAQKISPRSLDFGPVGIGQTAQLEVAITNQGTSNLTGWAGGGVPAPFNASQDCNIAGGLAPGSTCHYYFQFSPTSPGVFSADSNSADSFGNFSIHVTGTGVAPSMYADSLALDFGPVQPGVQFEQTVTITNTGLSPLTGWSGGAVPAPFNGSQDCNIQGGVLPGQSCHFYFTFSPTAEGQFSATSNFSANAGPLSIKLQGSGSLSGRTEPALYLPLIGK